MVILKNILNLYLKTIYGSFYGGMLSGGDVIWTIEDVSKNIINVLVILENESTNAEHFVKELKKEIFNRISDNLNQFPKLSSVRHRTMGYTYLIKHQIDVNECVTVTNINCNRIKISRNELEQIISAHSNKPLPNENMALWEIMLFSNPIEWINEKEHIAVLCRFSHVIGDGLSLISVFSTIFGNRDPLLEEYLKQNLKKTALNKNKHKADQFAKVLSFIHILLMSPFVIFHQSYLRKSDVNILHGPSLSGQKILVHSIEENEQLVPMVKKIKSMLPTVSFSEIILTAVSKSLDTYFQKVSIELLE